jgi:hypothetical protein
MTSTLGGRQSYVKAHDLVEMNEGGPADRHEGWIQRE